MAIYYGNSASIDNLTVSNFQGPVQSYYANMPVFQGSNTYGLTSALNLVQPMILPYDVSASYMRVLMTNTFNSTTFGTSVISINNTHGESWYANIYTLNNGTLSLYKAALASWNMRIGVSIQASNSQTVYYSITYPVTGSYINYTTSYSLNSATCNVSTTNLTQWNSNRFVDIPINDRIPAGDYWIAFQRSSSTVTSVVPSPSATAGTVLTGVTHNDSIFVATQINSNFAAFGAASNVSTQGLSLGLGAYSATAAGATSNAIAISAIQTQASHPVVPFQLIRGSNIY